ncbi:unnamed protein product [Echinostoma caproni]|uniref:LIM zinc-binding domain-containing protein n=1 Tax=Echinostoma caproni TaxID=27848 RepID=A0A183ABG1_9TREM|nr:unnamed protein product [Echinostoma caproni]
MHCRLSDPYPPPSTTPPPPFAGFPSKELRCRLALAITVNFVNYHTPAETQVEEISGVSSIFNQQFFARLAADTGIDLENIVYYKDETHYFVMTAKKHSLLAKGVLKQDREDSNSLLSPDNVDKQALQAYARETAHYVTKGQLVQLDFAVNARGEPDVEVFDFTRMFAAEYSCRIIERSDLLLMQCLIGDGLFEPFWPTGSGCALGFLSALDAAWAVSRLAAGMHPLQVIVQRESVYQRLSQTTAQNMPPNFSDYTLDPRTRYVRCDLNLFSPAQVRHLYSLKGGKGIKLTKNWYQEINGSIKAGSNPLRDQLNLARSMLTRTGDGDGLNQHTSVPDCNLALLRWFRFRLAFYESLELIEPVHDLSPTQWESGANLLCLIHLYRPDLVPELEQFVLDPDTQSDPRSVLNGDLGVPHPKPSLIRACGLLIEHFNVEFVADFDKGNTTTTYPRSDTDWQWYLTLVQEALSQLHMAGPPSIAASSKQAKSLTRTQSMMTPSNFLNKSPVKTVLNSLAISPKRKPVLEKQFDPSQTNGRVRGVFREDPTWSVEKGLLLKRRAELIATLQDPASTKRRSPIPPHLRPSLENANIDRAKKFVVSHMALHSIADRDNGAAEIQPSMIKPITVPESVARLFAPRKGSAHCYVCDKRLYLIERLMAFGLFFHRHCFRCSECGSQLQTDKATCVRATSRDERDKFFCPAHSQAANLVPSVASGKTTPKPRANHNSTGVSLEARLRAGEFPFGPPDRSNPTQNPSVSFLSSTRAQSLADLIPHNRPPPTMPSAVLPTRPGHSALLAGLRGVDDAEEIMGVPSPIGRPLRHPLHMLRDSSSSSASPERRPPSQPHRRRIGPAGDELRPNGIRDDAAPGPDCYLAGHLGLPEVERRANWELNQSGAWPDASIPDILEHMSYYTRMYDALVTARLTGIASDR